MKIECAYIGVRRHDLEDVWEVRWAQRTSSGAQGHAKSFTTKKEADQFANHLRMSQPDHLPGDGNR